MLAWKWDHEIFIIIMKNIKKILESRKYINSWLLISEKYYDLLDMFEKKNTNKLLSHRERYDIRIELESEKTLNFDFLYNISWEELQVL